MKVIASTVISLITCYIALILAAENLGAISTTACPQDFTLPGIVCRIGGGILTLLLVPAAGALSFFLSLYALESLGKKNE